LIIVNSSDFYFASMGPEKNTHMLTTRSRNQQPVAELAHHKTTKIEDMGLMRKSCLVAELREKDIAQPEISPLFVIVMGVAGSG
jgi:hypothetical protein